MKKRYAYYQSLNKNIPLLQIIKMLQTHIGEFAALLVAVFWTFSALAFESASKIVGSLAVNIIRLFLAFVFLSCLSYFYRGMLFFLEFNVRGD